MNVAIMLALIGLAICVWWLLLQKFRAKPWLQQGVLAEPLHSATFYPPQFIGLGVFLAVVMTLFALFAVAYHMRMDVPDWVHLPLPSVLLLNTALLVLGSIAMQAAWSAADRSNERPGTTGAGADHWRRARIYLQWGGFFAIAFLIGQLAAWQQLDAQGFYFSCSPASAFFYVLTALHGAHLLGGLLVWGKTALASARSDSRQHAPAIALSIRLCAIYWHFLLLIWLAVYALFAFT